MVIMIIEGMAVDSLQKGPVVASVALYTVLANLANKAQPPTQYRNASAALVRTRISAIGDCKLNEHIKWRDHTAADRATCAVLKPVKRNVSISSHRLTKVLGCVLVSRCQGKGPLK